MVEKNRAELTTFLVHSQKVCLRRFGFQVISQYLKENGLKIKVSLTWNYFKCVSEICWSEKNKNKKKLYKPTI